MPRRATLVNNLSKGVLDPGLGERIDLQQYWQGVRTGLNVEFLPQGGFRRRGGTRLATSYRARRKLEPVRITASMITAHNGGTTTNLVDQDTATLFTTSAVAAATHVVAEIDLGTATAIAAVDILAIACATSRADGVLAVEYWSGSAWTGITGPDDTLLEPRGNLRTEARTRRFAEPPGLAPTARIWRIVVYDGTALGAISLQGLRLWTERSDAVSNSRLIMFAKSATEIYQMILGDWGVDVYEDGVFVGSFPVPFPHHLDREINEEQSLDTLLLFHEDVPTPRVVRQGSADEWNIDTLPTTNCPDFSSSTAFSGAQDEVQRIAVTPVTAGHQLVVWLGDKVAAPFTVVDAATLPGQIQTALKSLPGVSASDVTCRLAAASPVTVEVTFSGSNGSRAWPRIAVRGLGASAVDAISLVHRRGLPASGTLMGDTTGWPRCGAIHESRLILGGFRAGPQSILFSVAGNVYDFSITGSPLTADKGMLRTIATDQIETIEEIVVGGHLQVLTERGQWWSDNRSFSATETTNFILATRYATARAGRPVFAGDATVFLESGDGSNRTVRDLVYNDVKVNYEADPALSLLAPHLITDAQAVAWRNAAATDEPNLLTVLNADGTGGLLSLLRKQEVVAWSRMTTDGLIRDVATDAAGVTWYLAERNGDLWFEKRDQDAIMDCMIEVDGSGLGQVTGLPACFEGKSVWALADGDVQGPFTVTGGAVLLDVPADETWIGLDFPLEVESLDMRAKLNEQMPFKPPVRIYEAELVLAETGHVQIGANGAEPEDVPLRHMDGSPLPAAETGDEPAEDALSVPMMDRLYSGRVTIQHLAGWTETGRWRIRQVRPAPLTVKAVRLEVSQRG